MNGLEFVDLAPKLLIHQPARCPAGFRSVVSRLYYGVYHDALKFVEHEMGFPHRRRIDNDNKHKYVQDYLLNSNEPHAQKLGDLLVTFHEIRKLADYELEDAASDTEDFATEAVARADRTIAALAECRQTSARTAIQTGMSIYHQRRNRPGRRVT